MLWTVVLILVVLWLLGFSFHIGGGLIHLILIIALIVLAIQLFQMVAGRRG
ncbi:MAG: lmo0937 family membrane protein [Gemmatimonadaceae bacterium]|nr:lmo0937 family membrane protein [Gemmatimonadaceae bacterium]